MDSLIIVACIIVVLLCCAIMFCQLCYRRLGKKRPVPERALLISDFLQPDMICKSVPCQHPYYRVISEYESRTYDQMPGIQETAEESNQETGKRSLSHSFNDAQERKRTFSLTNLPRYGKRKPSVSSVSSRCSSDSSTSSVPLSPVYKTKPIQITQVDTLQT